MTDQLPHTLTFATEDNGEFIGYDVTCPYDPNDESKPCAMRDALQARIDAARNIDTKDAADAPLWMQGDEADAWSDGWNACKWEYDRTLTGEAS